MERIYFDCIAESEWMSMSFLRMEKEDFVVECGFAYVAG